MSNKIPLILDVKGNSLDDGPGIRSVVFFKGCPLSCVWCHNPESKKTTPEISFDSKLCIGCDSCIEICTKNGLSRKIPFFIKRDKCDLCFDCTEDCPSGALEKVGRELKISEIMGMVLKDKPFFDTSKGGVTLSGGEPSFFMDYLSQLLKELKNEDIHTLLETCGQFEFKKFMKKIYPHLDTIYFDIKIFNSDDHKKFCGISNSTIIDNFKKLNSQYKNGKTEILPRIPLIPDITDTKENIESIISFFIEEGVNKTHLMAYHPMWIEKNQKIGIEAEKLLNGKMEKCIESDTVKDCKKMFNEAGITIL
jgi:pyruvate formate lyase activating enzyme